MALLVSWNFQHRAKVLVGKMGWIFGIELGLGCGGGGAGLGLIFACLIVGETSMFLSLNHSMIVYNSVIYLT